MVDVEQWAEIRRMHFVGGVSIKEKGARARVRALASLRDARESKVSSRGRRPSIGSE